MSSICTICGCSTYVTYVKGNGDIICYECESIHRKEKGSNVQWEKVKEKNKKHLRRS